MHSHHADHTDLIEPGLAVRVAAFDLRLVPGFPLPVPVPSGAPIPGIPLPTPRIGLGEDGDVEVSVDTGIGRTEVDRARRAVRTTVDVAGRALAADRAARQRVHDLGRAAGEQLGAAAREVGRDVAADARRDAGTHAANLESTAEHGYEFLRAGGELAGDVAKTQFGFLQTTAKAAAHVMPVTAPLVWGHELFAKVFGSDDATPAQQHDRDSAFVAADVVGGGPVADAVEVSDDAKQRMAAILADGVIRPDEIDETTLDGSQRDVLAQVTRDAEDFIRRDDRIGRYDRALAALDAGDASDEDIRVAIEVNQSKVAAIGGYQALIAQLETTSSPEELRDPESSTSRAIAAYGERLRVLLGEFEAGMGALPDEHKLTLLQKMGVDTSGTVAGR